MFQEHDAQSIKLILEKCRVVKDEYEIAMIRKANYNTCRGIEAVMARAKTAETEAELEAAFRERCISHHSKETAYPPIVAAGAGAATLHYVDNQQPLKGKLNLLIDAGCEWNNYASDIVRKSMHRELVVHIINARYRPELFLLPASSLKSLARSMTLSTR